MQSKSFPTCRSCWARSELRQANLNLLALDTHLKRFGPQLRNIGTLPVGELEGPQVAVADDGSVAEIARRQRRAHVRATVVQSVVGLADAKDSDSAVADGERLATALGNLAHLSDRDEFGHRFLASWGSS